MQKEIRNRYPGRHSPIDRLFETSFFGWLRISARASHPSAFSCKFPSTEVELMLMLGLMLVLMMIHDADPWVVTASASPMASIVDLTALARRV